MYVSEKVDIRKAQADDFAAVRLLAEALAAHIDEPPPPLTTERYLAFYISDLAPMQLFVAVRGPTVVGMIAWVLTHELYSGGITVFISDIAVRPDARGQGVGTALMAHAQAWGRTHGARKLGWDVWRWNATALSFYQRVGATVDTEAVAHVLKLAGH